MKYICIKGFVSLIIFSFLGMSVSYSSSEEEAALPVRQTVSTGFESQEYLAEFMQSFFPLQEPDYLSEKLLEATEVYNETRNRFNNFDFALWLTLDSENNKVIKSYFRQYIKRDDESESIYSELIADLKSRNDSELIAEIAELESLHESELKATLESLTKSELIVLQESKEATGQHVDNIYRYVECGQYHYAFDVSKDSKRYLYVYAFPHRLHKVLEVPFEITTDGYYTHILYYRDESTNSINEPFFFCKRYLEEKIDLFFYTPSRGINYCGAVSWLDHVLGVGFPVDYPVFDQNLILFSTSTAPTLEQRKFAPYYLFLNSLTGCISSPSINTYEDQLRSKIPDSDPHINQSMHHVSSYFRGHIRMEVNEGRQEINIAADPIIQNFGFGTEEYPLLEYKFSFLPYACEFKYTFNSYLKPVAKGFIYAVYTDKDEGKVEAVSSTIPSIEEIEKLKSYNLSYPYYVEFLNSANQRRIYYVSIPKKQPVSSGHPVYVQLSGGPYTKKLLYDDEMGLKRLFSKDFIVIEPVYAGSLVDNEYYLSELEAPSEEHRLRSILEILQHAKQNVRHFGGQIILSGGSYGGYATLKLQELSHLFKEYDLPKPCTYISRCPPTKLKFNKGRHALNKILLTSGQSRPRKGEFDWSSKAYTASYYKRLDSESISGGSMHAPTLLIHGKRDTNVPIHHSRQYYEQALKNGHSPSFFAFDDGHNLQYSRVAIAILTWNFIAKVTGLIPSMTKLPAEYLSSAFKRVEVVNDPTGAMPDLHDLELNESAVES